MNLLQSITGSASRKGNGHHSAISAPPMPKSAFVPLGDKEQLDEWIGAGSHAVLGYIITPSMAMAMLERNLGNRRKRARMIEQYAEQIASGRWPLTGQPIIFSDNGILNDGQNRLAACIKSGVAFPCDIRFGIARDSFMQTDIGAKRQASDVLEITGEKNVVTLAATAAHLNAWMRSGGKSIHRSYTATPSEILDLVERHPGLRASSGVGQYMAQQIRTAPSVIAFCHYLSSTRDPEGANRFFGQVASGEGLRKSDPAFALRKRLIDAAQSRTTMPAYILAGYALKAWNAYRKNIPVKLLRMDDGETLPEVL